LIAQSYLSIFEARISPPHPRKAGGGFDLMGGGDRMVIKTNGTVPPMLYIAKNG
jgi:hypothetical protein